YVPPGAPSTAVPVRRGPGGFRRASGAGGGGQVEDALGLDPVLGATAVLQDGGPGVAAGGALTAAHQQRLHGPQGGGEGRDGGGADGRGLHGGRLPRCGRVGLYVR